MNDSYNKRRAAKHNAKRSSNSERKEFLNALAKSPKALAEHWLRLCKEYIESDGTFAPEVVTVAGNEVEGVTLLTGFNDQTKAGFFERIREMANTPGVDYILLLSDGYVTRLNPEETKEYDSGAGPYFSPTVRNIPGRKETVSCAIISSTHQPLAGGDWVYDRDANGRPVFAESIEWYEGCIGTLGDESPVEGFRKKLQKALGESKTLKEEKAAVIGFIKAIDKLAGRTNEDYSDLEKCNTRERLLKAFKVLHRRKAACA